MMIDNFIEAMIKGHDKTEYRWVSGKYTNKFNIYNKKGS